MLIVITALSLLLFPRYISIGHVQGLAGVVVTSRDSKITTGEKRYWYVIV